MENIVIPDDFYFNKGVLAHISCIYCREDDSYSNNIFILIDQEIRQSDIDMLRDICDMYDILNEKTYFKEDRYKNLYAFISKNSFVLVNNGEDNNINFIDIESLLEYLAKHYPECIRSDDIKIALKD